jgi:hypothetical protein
MVFEGVNVGIGAVIAANAVVTKHVFLDLRQLGDLPMTCFWWRSRLRKGYAGAGSDQWALGRGTLKVATVPVAPDWRMKRDLLSQRYTTCMAELFTVKT